MKLAIVDYGMGNLKSIISAFKYQGISDISITHDIYKLKKADKLLLPGVGSFVHAMQNINKLELHKILDELVLEQKKPILGICLGMQLLCKSSNEDGGAEGLGYIDAICENFNETKLKVPHVGFNQVLIHKNTLLYDGLKCGSDFYFTHSFRLQSDMELNQSICNYGENFIASYEKNNIYGTQFHPELSQTNGLTLLKNFIEKC
jgi:imidazole glycerol-phosphate synthase subunit HisH